MMLLTKTPQAKELVMKKKKAKAGSGCWDPPTWAPPDSSYWARLLPLPRELVGTYHLPPEVPVLLPSIRSILSSSGRSAYVSGRPKPLRNGVEENMVVEATINMQASGSRRVSF